MRAPPTIDLYAVLGVARAATGAEIRRAYRRLALVHHPDRAGPGSAETFARLAEAYHMLSDPTARTAYDAHLFQREASGKFAAAGAAAAGAAPGGTAGSTGGAWSVSSVGWSASFKRPIPNLIARLSGPLDRLVAVGAAHLDDDGVLELRASPAEAMRGGTAIVEMPLSILCPTCGGVASPRGVWCRRCEHAGRVTEAVPVQVDIPRIARDGVILTTTLRHAGLTPQRARLRVAG